ncbi:MAG TPA: helix-turn-helix domain-containing protein [Bacteroidia bacterium]|nr:helix-turn-helix domain-containing protein [Bacteroidia bacterium]
MIIDGKEVEIRIGENRFTCAMDLTMSVIGGKWKTVVLWYLKSKPKRFSELKRHVPGISEKMLSLQLREMERDGIVKRTVFPEVPPRVEYELTKEGKTLIPALNAIAAWGREKAKRDGVITEVKKRGKKTGKKIQRTGP